jgi:hypothetical protein
MPAEGAQLFRLDSLYAQHYGKLSAVMLVMGQDPPESPLPRYSLRISLPCVVVHYL